jgi:hypothetical protein
MFWDLYQQYRIEQTDNRITGLAGVTADMASRRELRALDDKINQLAMVCRAMFELLQQSTGLSDKDLMAKVLEIDLRDGRRDGRMTPTPKRCPKCEAMISPKFGRCLFCGHEDPSVKTLV